MRYVRVALLGSICAAALAAPAGAQDVGQQPQPTEASDENTQPTELIVTGSRIARRDFTAESPIATVNEDFIENSGPTSVLNSLEALPQLRPTTRGRVNLRGLGSARSLVLFDSRRLQPSDSAGGIDINTIPSALIASVETITGGASAVYGSDAIAGVVNFRFNDRLRGLELEAEAGLSELGDASSTRISASTGLRFSEGAGRLYLSASHFTRGTASQRARAFYDNDPGTSVPTSGLVLVDATNPFQTGTPAAIAAYRNLWLNTYGTGVPVPASVLLLNEDRTLIGRTGGINLRESATTGYVNAADGIRQRSRSDPTLVAPQDQVNLFARGEFDVSDALTLYGQAMFTDYETDSLSASGVNQSTTTPIRIRADNPFVSPDLRIALNSRRNPNAPFTYYFTSTRIAQLHNVDENRVYQLLGGARGRLSDTLRYDVYVSHGETRRNDITYDAVSRSRFNAVVNAADGGRSLCDGGFDPFGFEPTSQSCADYLTIDTVDRYRYKQTIAQANMTGELFDLWGGPVAFAVGAEYRRNEYSAEIDPARQPGEGNVPPEALGTAGASSASGAVAVRELYAELLLPILRDRPFFALLDVNAAYRYSDYDRIGGVHTYKISGNYAPFDGLTFRGGYSRAIRAPDLAEIFAPRSSTAAIIGRAALGAGDPCDRNGSARNGRISGVSPEQVRALCIATGVHETFYDSFSYAGAAIAAYRTSNPELTEETADSYTIGAVVQPGFARSVFSNLSLSVDYYTISLKDAIGYVTSPVALNQCFNFGGLNPDYDPENFYCTLINRDAAGAISYVDERLFNLGYYKTSGIDVQLDASIGLGGSTALSLNSVFGYVIDYRIQTLASEPMFDYAGTVGNGQIESVSISHPDFKHVTTFTLSDDVGSLALRWRFIGAQDNAANVGVEDGTAIGVPAYHYFDLIGRVRVNESFTLRGGITNLANRQPPEFGGDATTVTSTYDILGRRFFIGATAKF